MFSRALCLMLLAAPAAATTCDAVWRDGPRGRDLPLRIDMPPGIGAVPAVLWSPGLGGGVGNAGVWVDAWRSAGLAVIRLQHPGSDGSVYAGAATPAEHSQRVRAAIGSDQISARIADVGFVADELARRAQSGEAQVGQCDLARIDMARLGLAGHSMGAWVVQAMAGQKFGPAQPASQSAIDRRFRAFIAMSSTGPTDPAAAAASFGDIGRPVLVITGSLDGVPAGSTPAIAAQALALRTALFTGLPADGRKALAVLAGADHMVFAGNTATTAADRRVQAAVAKITGLWWRRWLLDAARADAALARPLAAPNVWQRK